MAKAKKPLLHITAKTKYDETVDLFYYSKRQAAFFNPGLKGFEEREIKKENDTKTNTG